MVYVVPAPPLWPTSPTPPSPSPRPPWFCVEDDSDNSDDDATAPVKPADSDDDSDVDSDDDSDDDSNDSDDAENESELTIVATEPAAKKQRAPSGDSREAPAVPTPFKRVDAAKVEAEGHVLIDNSWDALRAKGHTYANKAQERLGPVKGKDFRKQMTKAKRGTYMCGAIDSGAVNSIKFVNDDDD